MEEKILNIMKGYLDKKKEIEDLFESEDALKSEVSKLQEQKQSRLEILNLKRKVLLQSLENAKELSLKIYSEVSEEFTGDYSLLITKNEEEINKTNEEYEIKINAIKEKISSLSKIDYEKIYLEFSRIKKECIDKLLLFKIELEKENETVMDLFNENVIKLRDFDNPLNRGTISYSDLMEESSMISQRAYNIRRLKRMIDEYLEELGKSNEEIFTKKESEGDSVRLIETPNEIIIENPMLGIDESLEPGTQEKEGETIEDQTNENEVSTTDDVSISVESDHENSIIEQSDCSNENLSEVMDTEQTTDSGSDDENNEVLYEGYDLESPEEILEQLLLGTQETDSSSNLLGSIEDKASEDAIITEELLPVSYHFSDGVTFIKTKKDLLQLLYENISSKSESMYSIRLNESRGYLSDSERYVYFKDENGKYVFIDTVNLNLDENIKLPNGEYINLEEFIYATLKYINSFKDQKYHVEQTDELFTVDSNDVDTLKESLKKCSIINVVRAKRFFTACAENRIYGLSRKSTSEKRVKSKIGETSGIPTGKYVSKIEAMFELRNLLVKLSQIENSEIVDNDNPYKSFEKTL